MTDANTPTPYIDMIETNLNEARKLNVKLLEALEFVAHGKMQDMRLWLVKNEPPQPNGHAPLISCNRAMLNALIAKITLEQAKE